MRKLICFLMLLTGIVSAQVTPIGKPLWIRSGSSLTPTPSTLVVSVANLSTSSTSTLQNGSSIGTATLAGGNSGTVAVLSDAFYQMTFMGVAGAMADATTYYFWNTPLALSTTSTGVLVPYNSTLIGYTANFIVNGGAGSAETGTIGINVNGTRTNLSTSIQQNSGSGINTYTVSNLSQDINSGSLISAFFTSPTWATNPGTTCTGITFYFIRRK